MADETHLDARAEETPVNLQENRALAFWEIASVSSSFLIAAWVILPFAGNSKLIGAIPVGLAFCLIFISHYLRRETPREIGWRLDNFLEAARLLVIPMMAAGLFVIFVGWLSGSLRLHVTNLLLRSLWLPVWGLMQEYVMQGYINRRAQIIWGKGWRSVLFVALLFAVFHLPNPWLTFATFVGGLLWSAVYQRAPNIPALGLSHGIMSLLLVSELPPHILNGLRVGFKFFSYNI